MSYQSQEEHDYFEGAAEQAEVEYQQECAYNEYLDSLYSSNQKDLYSFNKVIDFIMRMPNRDGRMEATFQHLIEIKESFKDINNALIDSELPF